MARFGIDIYMTTLAIAEGYKVGDVDTRTSIDMGWIFIDQQSDSHGDPFSATNPSSFLFINTLCLRFQTMAALCVEKIGMATRERKIQGFSDLRRTKEKHLQLIFPYL